MRIYVVLVILGALLLSACGDENIILPNGQQNQIHVAGTATIKAPPDIATIQIGVQTFSEEVEAAVDENNRKSEDIISALRQEGVAEKDIQTSRFNIYPQRDYKNNRPDIIIGFQVDNIVSATIRDLDSIGKVLQATIEAGANNINGLNFTLDDPTALRDEARAEAIKDARRRADIMAEAAGIQVGNVISITETSYPGPIIARADFSEDAIKSEVPIEPGELELTIQVQVIFAIDED
ncbi:SIMPL domain-containing protein [Candidatus Poribacteria bacterium]